MTSWRLEVLQLIAVALSLLDLHVTAQEYILTGPADTQFIPSNYQQPSIAYNPFQPQPQRGFQQIDSYLPQRDLQTSDLPFHLQQTLPQYRITTSSPAVNYQTQQQQQQQQQFNFQSSRPAPFRPQANIIPSTHRPNYSHLFSHAHNKNPSQPETFLGEITLQSPADPPPHYNEFKPSTFNQVAGQTQDNINQNLDYTERPNTIKLGNGNRANYLSHRTRIFAPDSSKSTRPQVKDYFVNNNGEVFITTKTPFVPKPTTTHRPPTTAEKKNTFSPATKPTGKPLTFNIKPDRKPFLPKGHSTTPKNSFDLEALLEAPIKSSKSNDDVVEVIKSIPADEEYTTEPTSEEEEETETLSSLEEETPTNEYSDEIESSQENNDIRDEEYIDEEEKNTTNSNSDGETIKLTNPINGHSNEFIETTEEASTESIIATSMSSSVNSQAQEFSNSSKEEPELVVSVVTTKSVINNTIIATATPSPPVTEKMQIAENSTDSWVVVASVQTSRSVSGARYLPSANVKQDERIKLLNEESVEEAENNSKEEHDDGSVEVTTRIDSDEDDDEAIISTSTQGATTKLRTSTESLIDKLDRVQSDLSSGLLTGSIKDEGNNIAVIKENADKMDATTMLDLGITPESSTASSATSTTSTTVRPAVSIKKFSSRNRPSTTRRPPGFRPKFQNSKTTASTLDIPQGDQPLDDKNTTQGRSVGFTNKTRITVQDVNAFLPPGFKNIKKDDNNSRLVADIIDRARKTFEEEQEKKNKKTSPSSIADLFEKVKTDDISEFLPPGFKLNETTTESASNTTTVTPTIKKSKPIDSILAKAKPVDDISALLPPGYKPEGPPVTTTSTTAKPKGVEGLLKDAKPVDISAFLPPGYKPPPSTTTKKPSKGVEALLNDAKPVDISAFLPPGYKPPRTTQKPLTTLEDVPANLLPPGFKPRKYKEGASTTTTTTSTPETTSPLTPQTTKSSGFKVVFPSRPGGSARKSATRLTTPRPTNDEQPTKVTPPAILKGWPSRATTEFTGWPTPSTTPISIEKLLEAARTASTSTTSSSATVTSTSTTTTTTTTTTTQKPTTPGICKDECDLAGTIKLIGGAKWVPELLDRNTKEWQILANEVQSQLENVYSHSNILNKWYKTVRIDGFSEGSVLVDYLVELNDLGRQIDTVEIKRLFHESLEDAVNNSNREPKALNETIKSEGKLALGNFIVDPKFTDFIVLPKQAYPTVGYAEDNVLLPQWAIAVIVIGLASLLFVIIFGVTVLVNRQKNAKKKAPTPLTEDMLNELNKNHMGGLDNYGADDLYNMEDVWNDRNYDHKLPKKRSNGSIHDNSMSNLYDSWRSEWNGYYYNAYYGNNPGSSHGGYGRRRSDYDTNF